MHRPVRPLHCVWFVAVASLLFAPIPAIAADLDWAAVADVGTVHVLTTDEDGDARATKIWLLVLDGWGYIRTSRRSTWGDNVEHNPDIGLRVERTDYPVRATFIVDEAERARIVAGFEVKYGSNPILNLFRGDDPRIMRLESR
jgi:hypothetical protein